MKRRIAFLDRDGTINVEKGYLYKIEEFEFLPGVIEGLKKLQKKGYLLVILTNQSGIGRGYYTVVDVENLHNWLIRKLKGCGVQIDAVYYCPHLPDARVARYRCVCNCRKPKTGLYWKAIHDLEKAYDLDLKNSVAIGDKMRDLTICKEIGARGVLIGRDNINDGIYTVSNFTEAVEWTLEE